MDEYLLLCEQIVIFGNRRHQKNVEAMRDLFYNGSEQHDGGVTQTWQESAFEDFANYIEAEVQAFQM